jgi:hypothetical protein
METFRDYLNEFKHEFTYQALIGLNKGREGMPLNDPITGKQLKDAKYLGKNMWLVFDGSKLLIKSIDKRNKISSRALTPEEKDTSIPELITMIKNGVIAEDEKTGLEEYISNHVI